MADYRLQPKKLKNTEAFKNGKKETWSKRGTSRKAWITLNEEIFKIYRDADGNME